MRNPEEPTSVPEPPAKVAGKFNTEWAETFTPESPILDPDTARSNAEALADDPESPSWRARHGWPEPVGPGFWGRYGSIGRLPPDTCPRSSLWLLGLLELGYVVDADPQGTV